MLTLNHDKTISVINPQVSFNITKLENLIALPENGADWVLSKDKNFLYVTMPSSGSVAVIDTIARKLVATLPTGKALSRRALRSLLTEAPLWPASTALREWR